MKLNELSLQLKQMLEVVDRLEFNAEQNRRQIAETRLLVLRVARALHVAEQNPKMISARKRIVTKRVRK